MTQLDVSEAPFDAAYCLFDAIGYVATNESLEKVFRGVHKHLRRDGLFIFEFWHAGAMLRHYDPVRVRRWKTDDSLILRLSETTLDYANQLSRVAYSIYELNTDGTYSTLTETQVNRYFLVQEMAAWLTSTGFAPVKWFAGFINDETISDQTWHIVAVARRNLILRKTRTWGGHGGPPLHITQRELLSCGCICRGGPPWPPRAQRRREE